MKLEDTYNHTIIQEGHPQSLLTQQDISSDSKSLELLPKPTKRHLKKLSLKYIYCPDCESQDITFYGKSSVGTQKHFCKSCEYQFVAQYDSIFPQSKRHIIFEEEFLSHLKPMDLTQKGFGKQHYWIGAKNKTMHMLQSDMIRIWTNKMIKSNPILEEIDYRVLLEFVVHEAYGRVSA